VKQDVCNAQLVTIVSNVILKVYFQHH